ncbi:MAG: F0F1 ATP synthase subunit B [Phycisphaerae bacterium]
MSRRLRLVIPVALILAVLVLVPLAMASGGEGGGGEASERPALLHWDFGAALWTIGVFVILLVILRLTAWKPILQGLNQREQFIRDALAEAKRDREAAEKTLAEYTDKMERSKAESAEILEEARRDGEETRRRIHAEAKAEADAMIERAKKEISLARDDAVKQLHDQTIMLATSVAGKMIQRELSAADHQALLDESLAELGRLNEG